MIKLQYDSMTNSSKSQTSLSKFQIKNKYLQVYKKLVYY